MSQELYAAAVDLMRKERRASTSFIQRRLSIGYNDAARIMERIHADGVVSAPNHVGMRSVLIDAAEVLE